MAIAKSWGRTSNCAAARRCRHRGRVSRTGEDPARRADRRLEAPIVLGDLHAAHAVRRSGLHRQARADVDSVLWLVSLESRSGAGRPQGEGRRDGRHDRSAREASSARAARSSSFPKGRAPRRARRRPTRAASRIFMRRPACRACRSRSTPACSGRAANSCAIRARSCWKCSIRFRRVSTGGFRCAAGERDRDGDGQIGGGGGEGAS